MIIGCGGFFNEDHPMETVSNRQKEGENILAEEMPAGNGEEE
jgi:hypothetical protein